MKVVKVNIDDLKFAEYNPRAATEKEIKDLKESLKRFGFVEPIVVNNAPKRKNVIIGGHFRVKVAKELGIKEIPVVYVNIPDLKREQELNLRLNKNLGHWDYDLLANFDEEMLLDVGWEEDEILEMFSLNEVEDYEIDFERYSVLMINPPGGVRLKERILIQFDSKNDYDKVKKFLRNKENEDLLKEKILEIIK